MFTKLIFKLPAVKRLRNELASTRIQLQIELDKHPVRIAKMVAETGHSDQAIEEILNGTETSSVMKAIRSLITRKIVELSDRSTDRPRATIIGPGGETVIGYTSDERLYDSGGCATLAELLAELQDLGKPKPELASPQERRAA